jgi:proteic killer suppression protein
VKVYYLDKDIQLLCEDWRHCQRKCGEKNAKRLGQRLREITAAVRVTELVAGRPHALSADRREEFSVDLYGGCRLVFRPKQQPPPTRATDGALDWAAVTEICIVYIGDYHD